MIWKLSIKNIKMHRTINIIIITQLTVMFIISILCVSTITSRYKEYSSIKEYLQKDGIYADIMTVIYPESGFIVQDSKELEKSLKSADVIACYNLWIEYKFDGYFLDIKTRAYDKEIISSYKPLLKDGRYLDEKDNDTDIIEAVVSNNNTFKVGDTIFGKGILEEDEDKLIQVKIVGVLEEGATIYGTNTISLNNDDYRIFFENYYFEIEENPMFLISKEDIDSTMKNMEGCYIETMLQGTTIITYDENVSQYEKDYNNEYLSQYGFTSMERELKELDANSEEYIFSQVSTLLPIIISVFILTMISSLSTNAISTKNQLRNFSIFYICGLRWKKCIMVNIISSIILLSISVIMTALLLYGGLNRGIISNKVVEIGVYQIGICVIIAIIYVILSMLLPMKIIGENTPNEILKQNNRG